MDKGRRLFVAGGSLAIAELMTGCVTSSLLENRPYREEVSSVLVSEDGRSLVVIGKDYHYVFDAPPVLVKTLEARFHPVVDAHFDEFTVDEQGNITGTYRMWLVRGASEEEKGAARAVGYTLNRQNLYEYSGTLSGKRYDSGGIQPEKQQRLNRVYSVAVLAPKTDGEKVREVALTPVSVAADGLLVLGGIALVLVLFYLDAWLHNAPLDV